mgnify:CR=1 FL=1
MVGLYTDYISMLISRQQPHILTQTVRDWMDVSDEYFDQGFVTMLSTQRDVITLNILQLLHQVLDRSGTDQLNLTGDKFKSKRGLTSQGIVLRKRRRNFSHPHGITKDTDVYCVIWKIKGKPVIVND